MTGFLLDHATIVTMNSQREIIPDGAIRILGDRIMEVASSHSVKAASGSPDEHRVDLNGKVIFPGLINTHNHMFQTLTKGLGDDRVLADWLRDMTFPAASYLDEETVYWAAVLACLEGIHSGTTTVLDYMYPHPRAGLSEPVIRAFLDTGVRGLFGRGMMDTGEQFGCDSRIQQDTDEALVDAERLLQKYGATGGKVNIWLAPAALWSNSEGMLNGLAELQRRYGARLSVHISETPFDRQSVEMLHGRNELKVLSDFGLLNNKLLMVHSVWLTDQDIELAASAGAAISHNPVSNMYLSSGVAPIPKARQRGIPVGLATDGPASNNSQDMVEVLKFAALLHKVHHLNPVALTAGQVLEMATIEGARAVGLEHEIGSLEVGKKADLFVFNPELSLKAVPMHNPVSTLVYSSSPQNIEMVMVDGKIVMENGQSVFMSETTAVSATRRVAEDLRRRAGITIKPAW
ncbi:amidohydrolase family protein [Paradesulfitobacterium ferrireducens]|uniref:amidohydrolase family protein n=1 Tax=Paradesulfitobacterium ferrireducens TaxID=2816476 RepID=UPI001A8D0030|nr:amidohydrolase [Paradesulfitobacterium ferrireducens]